MMEAVRQALKYMQTPTLKKYSKHAIVAPASSSDEDILVCFRLLSLLTSLSYQLSPRIS